MASPSLESWMSHSMAKLPSTAACAAAGMFSTKPREISCRPRWATGRAVSQSGARMRGLRSGHFEDSIHLDGGIRGQGGDADGGAGMPALVAEGCDHQVGGAVEYLGAVEEVWRGIDEAAEPDHADHLVEIAERGLDLGQQIDAATLRRRVALFDGDAGAQLALGDQLAFRIGAHLAGDEQQIAGTHEADVIRHRGTRLVQDDALRRQLLFDRTRHVFRPRLI